MSQAVRGQYAGPTFLNSPPASALPLPRASWRSLGVSGAQAKRERRRRLALVIVELQRRRQVIIDRIDRIERHSTKAIDRNSPQEMIEIQDQSSAISANVQREEQETQQTWINRLQQLMEHAAEILILLIRAFLEPKTDNLPRLAIRRLLWNLTKQQDLTQRLDIINKEIEHTGTLADNKKKRIKNSNEVSLASADDEHDQMDFEIDGYEYQHEAVVLPRNLILVLTSGETLVNDPEEHGVGDDGDANQELVDGHNIIIGEVVVDEEKDEGYHSQEEQS